MKNIKIIILSILLGISGTACTGFISKAKSDFTEYREIVYPDGKKERTKTYIKGQAQNTKDAKDKTQLEVTKNGVVTQLSAAFEQNNKWFSDNIDIFWWASIGFLAAGLLLIGIVKEYTFGGCLLLASGICAVAPSFLSGLEAFIPYIIGALLLIGIVYVIGRWFNKRETRNKGFKDAAKLMAEGKKEEATAILRAVEPKIDKSFKDWKRGK